MYTTNCTVLFCFVLYSYNKQLSCSAIASDLTNLGPRPAGSRAAQVDALRYLENVLARDAPALNQTRNTYTRVYVPKPQARFVAQRLGSSTVLYFVAQNTETRGNSEQRPQKLEALEYYLYCTVQYF